MPNDGGVDSVAAACPFCFSRQRQVYEMDAGVWAVYCVRCKAVGPHAASRQDAIAQWENRR